MAHGSEMCLLMGHTASENTKWAGLVAHDTPEQEGLLELDGAKRSSQSNLSWGN